MSQIKTDTDTQPESAPVAEPVEQERRNGPADRRATPQERRNPERAADDMAPRRNPDVGDRRKP